MTATDTPEAPRLAFFARLGITVATPLELGEMGDGRHRIIPITGGEFSGPDVSGVILPAGADFQVIRSETSTELLAKYAIETSEGERISVDNFGIRTASAEDTRRLAEGEPVPPGRVYFRCFPRLRGSGRWSWLQDRLFIGTGQRFPDRVQVDIFEVQ